MIAPKRWRASTTGSRNVEIVLISQSVVEDKNLRGDSILQSAWFGTVLADWLRLVEIKTRIKFQELMQRGMVREELDLIQICIRHRMFHLVHVQPFAYCSRRWPSPPHL